MKAEERISELLNSNFKEKEEFNRQRYNSNKEIINIIEEYIENNKNLRFIQILWILDIVNNVDRFNEEPEITLKRIRNRLDNITRIQKGNK